VGQGSAPLAFGRGGQLQLPRAEAGGAPGQPCTARAEGVQVVLAQQQGRERVESGRERQGHTQIVSLVQEGGERELATGIPVASQGETDDGALRTEGIAAPHIGPPAEPRRIGGTAAQEQPFRPVVPQCR
jgi:hypothetical protein